MMIQVIIGFGASTSRQMSTGFPINVPQTEKLICSWFLQLFSINYHPLSIEEDCNDFK